ncbi:hypothetical protein ACOME3_006861 [Neoechinorhynchus agilis]
MIRLHETSSALAQYLRDLLKRKDENGMIRFPDPNPTGLKIIIDYPSLMVAKSIHAGHFKAAIIGESLNRFLTILGNQVIAINHLSDWRPSLSSLIVLLLEKYGQRLSTQSASTLLSFQDIVKIHTDAEEKFNKNISFQNKSLKALRNLRSFREPELSVWKLISNISKQYFRETFSEFGLSSINRPESFYVDYAMETIKDLIKKDLVTEEDGCTIVRPRLVLQIKKPMVLLDENGHFTRNALELTALRHRLVEENADWVLYVLDSGQSSKFDNIFKIGKAAGWIVPNVHRVEHVKYGVALELPLKKLVPESKESLLVGKGLRIVEQPIIFTEITIKIDIIIV